MRRTIFLFSSLLITTVLCLAQEQAIDTSTKQDDGAPQQNSEQANNSLRDPALNHAPDAVKEQVIRHASAQTLKELKAQEGNGATIYEAVFEGQNVETRLRMDEAGAPISMHIVGLGAPIDEAAGARRDDPPQQNAQPQPASTPQQQPAVPDELRQRIQQQLGDEIPLLDVQPKVFYQLNVRQNGNVQQIWADETGKVLREE